MVLFFCLTTLQNWQNCPAALTNHSGFLSIQLGFFRTSRGGANIREVNDIMNHCITGWKYFSNPRIFEGYGRQKGWEREAPATGADNGREKTPDGFVEVTEQMELPF